MRTCTARRRAAPGWTFDAATIENRLAEQRFDGVDAELIFPNGAPLLMWSSGDHEFVEAQCRIYNDWAMEVTGPYKDRCNVAAAIPTADLQGAIAEVEHAADLGYRVLMLPCKPIWGPHNVAHLNYNLPHFDPLWSVIQDVDMPMAFHVSTGMDPRLSRGNGGAVINYAVFSLAPTAEPVANLCASGVIDRFPNLKFATIEANAGWVPWFLQCPRRGVLEAPLLGAAQARTHAERVLPHQRRLLPGRGPGRPGSGRAP